MLIHQDAMGAIATEFVNHAVDMPWERESLQYQHGEEQSCIFDRFTAFLICPVEIQWHWFRTGGN
jgi:hypothetical protein